MEDSTKTLSKVIRIDETEIRSHLDEMVRGTVEETLNILLKSMMVVDYQQYLDRYWRPAELIMTNHQTGKSTTLGFGNYQCRTGLQDADFSPGAISRVR